MENRCSIKLLEGVINRQIKDTRDVKSYKKKKKYKYKTPAYKIAEKLETYSTNVGARKVYKVLKSMNENIL
jgi:hypothetical protein